MQGTSVRKQQKQLIVIVVIVKFKLVSLQGIILNKFHYINYFVVGLIPRHLCLIEGNTAQFSQCAVLQPLIGAKTFRNFSSKGKRTINVTPKDIKNNETTGISSNTKVTSINTENSKIDKPESLAMSSEKKPENGNKEKTKKGTPIIKVLADLKEGSAKTGDVKVNLENVKEQSLEKPIPIMEAPIQQLKEKIMELKAKEPETGMMSIFWYFFDNNLSTF